MQKIEELVLFVVKDLAEDKDSVEVSTLESNEDFILDIRVSKNDIAKIIGKKGKVINAVRGLVNLYSIKNNKRILVEINEKEEF